VPQWPWPARTAAARSAAHLEAPASREQVSGDTAVFQAELVSRTGLMETLPTRPTAQAVAAEVVLPRAGERDVRWEAPAPMRWC
jgi:hypothetical protein